MGELIAVVSGKGGTGKTSVCAGIATALAESGKRVLCVDCDVGLRNLDISLGMSDCGGLSFLDVCEFGYELENAPHHPIYDNLSFLTAPMNRSPEDINTESFIALFQRARERFDYIFLDAPAGVDAGFRLVCAAADSFLVVTGAGPAAVRDAARVGELLELAGKTNARLIVNRVDKDLLSTVRLNWCAAFWKRFLPPGRSAPWMCRRKTASVGRIWNFDFRRILFEQKEEVKQIRLPG